MKLYNKIFTLGLVASAMAMTGCSNSFLDIEDPTRTLIGEYMSTDEHIQGGRGGRLRPSSLARLTGLWTNITLSIS